MTTIAAIKTNGQIAMAADAGRCFGAMVASRTTRKIHHRQGFAIASSGESRAASVLAENLHSAPGKAGTAESAWQWIKDSLSSDGFAWKPDGDVGAVGCGQVFLVCIGPSLYLIDGCGSVSEIPEDEGIAIGSGAEYAIGAMEAARVIPSELEAQHVAELAIFTSKKWDTQTNGGHLVVHRGVDEVKFNEMWVPP